MRALLIALFCFFGVMQSRAIYADDLNGEAILQASIKRHDPDGRWQSAILKFHAEEPRLGNPRRYSRIMLDNNTGAFTLERNRDQHISIHTISDDGAYRTTLDGKIMTDPDLIKKYRLAPARNIGYRKFSHDLYGLPMSLSGDAVAEYGETTETTYNGDKSYRLSLTLKDGFFSNYWAVYIAVEDERLLGVEMIFPDDPLKGERLYFDKEIEIAGMYLPRIRHWHELSDDSYSGSDIIVKSID